MTAETGLAVGVVGCGAISDVYLSAISRSPALRLKALSGRGLDRARAQAERFGGDAVTFESMLADPDIDIIVDLTPGAAHAAVNQQILDAGKHLYTEKPLALRAEDARQLIETASRGGLRIGSAPDTFFGGAHQAARAFLDSGEIGMPVVGSAFVGFPGVELFHPRPAQFYRPGTEGPLDIGPYFVTQLVSLLGPVAWVAAGASYGKRERQVEVGPDAGAAFRVDIPTSFAAVLGFSAGPIMTLTTSLDVWKHRRNSMELYCTEGSLTLADPNFFGGPQEFARRGHDWCELSDEGRPFSAPNRINPFGDPIADYRGAGIVDLALSILDDRPHRTQPDLALHVVDVLASIVALGTGGGHRRIGSTCRRPRPLDVEADAELIEKMPSPYPLS